MSEGIRRMISGSASPVENRKNNNLAGNFDPKITQEGLFVIPKEGLTEEDNHFLLGFKNLSPDWSIYDFEKFPPIQWKLQNLTKLKNNNPSKYDDMVEVLRKVLYEPNQNQIEGCGA